MKVMSLLLVGVLFLATGCTTTEKYATVGGLSGAALGGIVGHQYDNGVAGTGVGGLVGTAGGVIIAERSKRKMTDYEEGYQDGYLKGQADYARLNWDQNTGKCPKRFTTITVDGVPEGKVDGVIYEPEYQEFGGVQ